MRLDCKCSSDTLRFIEVQCFELTVKWWRLHGMRRMYALALRFQLISTLTSVGTSEPGCSQVGVIPSPMY